MRPSRTASAMLSINASFVPVSTERNSVFISFYLCCRVSPLPTLFKPFSISSCDRSTKAKRRSINAWFKVVRAFSRFSLSWRRRCCRHRRCVQSRGLHHLLWNAQLGYSDGFVGEWWRVCVAWMRRRGVLGVAGHGDHLCALEIDDRGRSNVYLWLSQYQRSIAARFARFGILFGRQRCGNGRITTERTKTTSRRLLLNMEKETVQVCSHINRGFSPRTIVVFLRQILGLKEDSDISVDDPCSDEFYQYFRDTARKNAQIYEVVFNTIPTNEIRLFTDVAGYRDRPKLKETDPLAVWSSSLSSHAFTAVHFLRFRHMSNANKFRASSSSFPWNF